MKTSILFILALASGQLLASETYNFNSLGLAVPDASASGVSISRSISSGILQIGSVQVTLKLSGNFNGDLYAYLVHGNALSVLLNRPGRTSANHFGFDNHGFQLTLSDSAPNGDIHTYRSDLSPQLTSPLTGLWQPDGRYLSPTSVLDSDPRTAGLSVFNGMDASGTWSLFVADFSLGGTSTLESWGLTISPSPSPPHWLSCSLAVSSSCGQNARLGDLLQANPSTTLRG